MEGKRGREKREGWVEREKKGGGGGRGKEKWMDEGWDNASCIHPFINM